MTTAGDDSAPSLSIDEFKKQLSRYILDCGFFRERCKNQIESLHNRHDAIIALYEEMIETVTKQITDIKNKIKEAEQYDGYALMLIERINNEIARQKRYMEQLKAQLSKTKTLQSLFSLNLSELFEAAKNDKSIATLIIQTPELVAKISDAQIEHLIAQHITSEDNAIAKSLASTLVAREYTVALARAYDLLKQRVETEVDKNFIADKENEVIRKLLLKINNYLDRKIEKSLKEETQPWSLGYFGSRYQVNKDDKKVSVPQGIHELKMHLAQLEKTPVKQILNSVQATLKSKLDEAHDESFLQQIKRYVSYIFGYHRSQATIEEYEHLYDALSMKNPF